MSDNPPEPARPSEQPEPEPGPAPQPPGSGPTADTSTDTGTEPAPQQAMYAPPPPATPPSGAGALWGGVGIGCASYMLLALMMIFLVELVGRMQDVIGPIPALIIYFSIPALVGVGLAIALKTRKFGIGMLIAAAASWLIVLGPCIGLLNGAFV